MLTFGLWIISSVTFTDAASFLFKDDPLYKRSCDVGTIVQNECNKCICTLDHIYECLPMEKPCKTPTRDAPLCHPSNIYVLKDTICICNSSGHWPHRQCDSIFKSLTALELGCEPNSYFVVGCNVCRCGSDGQLDKNHCTKNKCKKPRLKSNNPKARRFTSQNNVYGSCEAQSWYSLAPCQFCYCINENKLVCNTGNNYAQKLEIGAYNLSICGKELIREAMELMPENQNYLRFGIDTITNTGVIPSATELNGEVIKDKVDDETVYEIKANHEVSVKKELPKNTNDSYEYYSESEEETPSERLIKRGGPTPSTQLPYDEKSEEDAIRVKTSEKEFESDSEMGVEIETPIKPARDINKELPAFTQKTSMLDLNEALKFNLPIVLDKVFKMALKRSMVSVETNTKCKPGAATFTDCNVCFCVDVNNLMCTNHPCKVKT